MPIMATRKIHMSRRLYSSFFAVVTAGAFTLCAAQYSQAEDTQRVRIRGTIESLSGDTLMLKTREGPEQKIAMKAGWKVSGIKRASVDDIKPGDFVGVGSMPKSNGPNDAIQVLIFPASMKGTGEGDRPWDAKPNTDMTNATVSNAVKAVNGHTITLAWQGKEKTISIPDGTQIVTLSPATKDDLKPGAGVIVSAEKASDGSVSGGQVSVGLDGITPM
jgi:hypothetical protein